MLPDFHPKMWLPNWLKPVEEQLRVEFPCTSTKMTWRLLYMLLLCTRIREKKKNMRKSILFYLCTSKIHLFFFRNRKVTPLPLYQQCMFKKGPHTAVSNNLKCFWCTLTAACLHCGGRGEDEANCSFTKMTRAFLWDAIPQWNDFWAWKPSQAWVMGTLMTSWGFVCSNDKFR